MERIIQYQSILTVEWRDLMRLYPEADEDQWLELYRLGGGNRKGVMQQTELF